DLEHYIKEKLTQCTVLVSVVGNVNEAGMQRLLTRYVSQLPKPEKCKKPKLTPVTQYPESETISLDMPISQSVVVFGQRGLDVKHKDFYALHLLNYIWGAGGFESRLMREIREKRGLA